MRKKRNKVESKTVIIDNSDVEHENRRRHTGRYFLYVLIGALVVVSFLVFLTYKSVTVLFPWIFGREKNTSVTRSYVQLNIPVWDSDINQWTFMKKKVADAGDEFTISYIYSQFINHHGFSLGYDTGNNLRIVSVEKQGAVWDVYMSGSGIPFYTSYTVRKAICDALQMVESNINQQVKLYYDGADIRDYIHCGKKDGFMVFYLRGSSVRARWVYDSVNKSDVKAYFEKILSLSSDYGDTNLKDIVEDISYENNVLKLMVKEGAFVDASPFVREALIYNMMYMYPYITTIEIDDPASFPYTDVRLDPIILVPTSGEDFLAKMGDRLTFTSRLKKLFPIISDIKIGGGRAVVDVKDIPSREDVEAIVRSVISAKNVSSVVLTLKGKIPPFWADPFEEDF